MVCLGNMCMATLHKGENDDDDDDNDNNNNNNKQKKKKKKKEKNKKKPHRLPDTAPKEFSGHLQGYDLAHFASRAIHNVLPRHLWRQCS